jgi:hypothetical protein
MKVALKHQIERITPQTIYHYINHHLHLQVPVSQEIPYV